MKNFIVAHTFKSDEAMEAYFAAMETMNEADIRGAMKMKKRRFRCNGMRGKMTKLCSAGGRRKALRQSSKRWATWALYLIMTSKKCQAY